MKEATIDMLHAGMENYLTKRVHTSITISSFLYSVHVSTDTSLLCYSLNLSCVDEIPSYIRRSVALPAWPKPVCLTMNHKVKWSTRLPG